ncbi:MAG: rhodanese-like domain-containing protein [Saprospiraceae bacterium]|jgi:rhodanese-related sulfurtransferase|nr:rhodanese-like domain-containing protein [Saprospiraceae bacterium]MBX7163175.1 rhodanese-like domain-containing protein [Saprospiraceae bacterium]
MEKKKSILQTLRTLFLILTVSLSMTPLSAQDSRITNPKFAKLLQKMLSHSVPELSCVDFNNKQDEFIILDTREPDEYYVSHIKNARHLGYDHLSLSQLDSISREKKIICYCSIGYRSEKVAEKIKKKGFYHVYNLYGGIFEMANRGFTIVDSQGQPTVNIHPYSSLWGIWMTNPKYNKVYH